jgi:hypothetical protein
LKITGNSEKAVNSCRKTARLPDHKIRRVAGQLGGWRRTKHSATPIRLDPFLMG